MALERGASIDLQSELDAARQRIDIHLDSLLVDGNVRVLEAMRYAVLGGGKRLRPILCLWSHDCWSQTQTPGLLDVACAVELMHGYSLIHDDLPSMDNDHLRRGRPTCHVHFDEATAILAGDGLLNRAFEVVLTASELSPQIQLTCARILADAGSHRQLVGGQMLDLESEGLNPDAARLEKIHKTKTAALIAAPIRMGALVAAAPRDVEASIEKVGLHLGLAFQIIDDVLDITRPAKDLGKSSGKDMKANKMTYPALYGVDVSRKLAHDQVAAALEIMQTWPRSHRLIELARYFEQRLH